MRESIKQIISKCLKCESVVGLSSYIQYLNQSLIWKNLKLKRYLSITYIWMPCMLKIIYVIGKHEFSEKIIVCEFISYLLGSVSHLCSVPCRCWQRRPSWVETVAGAVAEFLHTGRRSWVANSKRWTQSSRPRSRPGQPLLLHFVLECYVQKNINV